MPGRCRPGCRGWVPGRCCVGCRYVVTGGCRGRVRRRCVVLFWLTGGRPTGCRRAAPRAEQVVVPGGSAGGGRGAEERRTVSQSHPRHDPRRETLGNPRWETWRKSCGIPSGKFEEILGSLPQACVLKLDDGSRRITPTRSTPTSSKTSQQRYNGATPFKFCF